MDNLPKALAEVHLLRWIATYPLDKVICSLNNWGQLMADVHELQCSITCCDFHDSLVFMRTRYMCSMKEFFQRILCFMLPPIGVVRKFFGPLDQNSYLPTTIRKKNNRNKIILRFGD